MCARVPMRSCARALMRCTPHVQTTPTGAMSWEACWRTSGAPGCMAGTTNCSSSTAPGARRWRSGRLRSCGGGGRRTPATGSGVTGGRARECHACLARLCSSAGSGGACSACVRRAAHTILGACQVQLIRASHGAASCCRQACGASPALASRPRCTLLQAGVPGLPQEIWGCERHPPRRAVQPVSAGQPASSPLACACRGLPMQGLHSHRPLRAHNKP